MNLNCKLSLTDEQRNAIKRHLTGKDVKAMATRAEVCELVQELLEPFLTAPPKSHERKKAERAKRKRAAFPVGMTDVPPHRPNPPAFAEGHDDCCKANELLQRRVNVLQHRLDTR